MDGRGVNTRPTAGGAGVYFLAGALGSSTVVNNATAWGMCMQSNLKD